MKELLQAHKHIGISGTRSPAAALQQYANRALIRLIETTKATILTGCASGIDEMARELVPRSRIQVFKVATGEFGTGPSAYALRSIRVVETVAERKGLWVSFPGKACPTGLVPSALPSECFCGRGSGSWAALALAIGKGLPTLVYLGAIPLPHDWPLQQITDCTGWCVFQGQNG